MKNRVVKKFEDYVKEELSFSDDQDNNFEEIDKNNITQSDSIDIDSEIVNDTNDQEEEEGRMYIGQKMIQELANKLNSKVANNSILYNGKKINFFSETEKFHVDGKKFSTSDEVVNYLTANQKDDKVNLYKDVLEEEPVLSESKSNRYKRNFQTFSKKK